MNSLSLHLCTNVFLFSTCMCVSLCVHVCAWSTHRWFDVVRVEKKRKKKIALLLSDPVYKFWSTLRGVCMCVHACVCDDLFMFRDWIWVSRTSSPSSFSALWVWGARVREGNERGSGGVGWGWGVLWGEEGGGMSRGDMGEEWVPVNLIMRMIWCCCHLFQLKHSHSQSSPPPPPLHSPTPPFPVPPPPPSPPPGPPPAALHLLLHLLLLFLLLQHSTHSAEPEAATIGRLFVAQTL